MLKKKIPNPFWHLFFIFKSPNEYINNFLYFSWSCWWLKWGRESINAYFKHQECESSRVFKERMRVKPHLSPGEKEHLKCLKRMFQSLKKGLCESPVCFGKLFCQGHWSNWLIYIPPSCMSSKHIKGAPLLSFIFSLSNMPTWWVGMQESRPDGNFYQF